MFGNCKLKLDLLKLYLLKYESVGKVRNTVSHGPQIGNSGPRGVAWHARVQGWAARPEV